MMRIWVFLGLVLSLATGSAFANNSENLRQLGHAGDEVFCYWRDGAIASFRIEADATYFVRHVSADRKIKSFEILRENFVVMTCDSVWVSTPPLHKEDESSAQ